MLSNLKLVRLTKGLTGREVAKKLNVTPAYISKLENGSAVITSELLTKFARIYEVNPKELI